MRIVILLLGLALPSAALAIDQSYQTWTSVAVHKALSENWALYFDANGRFYHDFDTAQVLLRPGVMRKLNDQFSLYLAYAWTPAWSDDDADMTDEHRIWQQLTWNSGGKLSLFSRSRLEQRFRPGNSSDVGVRFREFVRLLWRATEHFGISLWDEVFIDLNHAENHDGRRWQRFGLDQNRVFAGPSFWLPAGVRIEVGYLNQYIDLTAPQQMRHILALNGFVDF